MVGMDEIIIYDNGRCEGKDDKYGYIIHKPPRHNYATIHEQDGNIIRMCLEYTTSKYKKALTQLSHYQCLFNNKYVLKSPIYINNNKVYKKSNKKLRSVKWEGEAEILPLTGDVIIKGKIDHEMEACLILYKYNYYLRYKIEWPVLLDTQATSATSSGVWYTYTMITKEGFINNDNTIIHNAFIPAFKLALKLPSWASDIIPQSLLINNTIDGGIGEVNVYHKLPQLGDNMEYMSIMRMRSSSMDDDDDDDKINPFIQLPTLSNKGSGSRISMVITQDAIISLRDNENCLISSTNEQQFIIVSNCCKISSIVDNIFWTYVTGTSSTEQIWSSKSLPKSSTYKRQVELVDKAMKYIIRNNKTSSSSLTTTRAAAALRTNDDISQRGYGYGGSINELRLLYERVWPDVGSFFCYELPSYHESCYNYHSSLYYYYRCLFNDKSRIIFYSSGKGGKGIDEANGIFKFMDVNGIEKEMSWSIAAAGCRSSSSISSMSKGITPYVEAALSFVRWVIIEEENKSIININKSITSEMVEDILQRSRDLRTVHELGGRYLNKIDNKENNKKEEDNYRYENEDHIISCALNATRAFLNIHY